MGPNMSVWVKPLGNPGETEWHGLNRQTTKPIMRLYPPNSRPKAAIGSIRFDEGATHVPPAKFIRVHPETSPQTIVEAVLDVWQLAPPSAVLTLPPTRSTKRKIKLPPHVDSVLCRGIAEATQKTQAWLFTGGYAERGVAAQVAGRAVSHGRADFGALATFTCFGIAPWSATRGHEEMDAAGHNGLVHDFTTTPRGGEPKRALGAALGEMPSTMESMLDLTPRGVEDKGEGKKGASIELPPTMGERALDTHHTHFLLVDDADAERVDEFRKALEKFMTDADLSGDGIPTPMMLLVVSGDASVFKWVRDALDDQDDGLSLPVLVGLELLLSRSSLRSTSIHTPLCPSTYRLIRTAPPFGSSTPLTSPSPFSFAGARRGGESPALHPPTSRKSIEEVDCRVYLQAPPSSALLPTVHPEVC